MSVFERFQNIFKIEELKNRIFFTLALLAVYRIGAHVPTPGIDGQSLSEFFENGFIIHEICDLHNLHL